MAHSDSSEMEAAVGAGARYVKVSGGGGTGKTLAIARRAAWLLAHGTRPEDLIVFCIGPSAVAAMRACMEAEGAGAAAGRVMTLAEYCQQVLSAPAAREATGRNPRLLADFEERILMEDMKVCGVKRRRLREMLKFFYKQWTELGDEERGFIRDSEESDVYATLTENLRLRNAMLRQELSNVAVKFVRDHPDEAAFAKVGHVLVDDYMDLNRASQVLLDLLSTECLFVTGNPNETLQTTEPYPCPEGFGSFSETHEGTLEVQLRSGLRAPDRISAMANSLVVNGGLDASQLVSLDNDAPASVHVVKWTYPNDEFLGVARHIKHRLADDSHHIRPRDVFVSVPNAMWGRALAKVLAANDIKSDLVLSHDVLRGDPRDLEKSRALQAYTRLNLVADPEDVVAWRSWCAFGDYLTNSNHWFRLEKWAQEGGRGIMESLDLLERLEDKPFEKSEVLLERYRSGRRFVEENGDKKGFALLNACSPVRGEEPPAAFMALVEPVEGVETAAELLARANTRLENRFSDRDAVRIGPMSLCAGMSFDTAIITGAVEGFYPAAVLLGPEYDDERVAEAERDERRAWYNVMTKSRYELVVSTVQKDESNTAAALGMRAHRIRMEDGKSMAVLAPSGYLAEMGEDAPGIEASLS